MVQKCEPCVLARLHAGANKYRMEVRAMRACVIARPNIRFILWFNEKRMRLYANLYQCISLNSLNFITKVGARGEKKEADFRNSKADFRNSIERPLENCN